MNVKQKVTIGVGAFALAFGNGIIAHTTYGLSVALIVGVCSLFGGLYWFTRPTQKA